jgi:two-component system, LytTR family, sensor kinase
MTSGRLWRWGFALATLIGGISGAQRLLIRWVRDQPLDVVSVVGAHLVPWYLWALLLPSLSALVRHRVTSQGLSAAIAWRLAAGSVVIAVAHTLLCVVPIGFVSAWTIVNRPLIVGAQQLLLNRGVTAWLECALLLSVLTALAYHERTLRHGLEVRALERSVADAELRALRMQLEPHFLFNTLNAIGAYIRSAPETAEAMLRHLSAVLRAVLDGGRAPVTTLEHEVELVRAYLAIHQVRMGERLQVDFVVPAEVLALRVPTLLLQPVVENAIVHGAARRPGPVRVQIGAVRCADRLQLTVVDSGRAAGASTHHTSGVGLSNTRARLQHTFGNDHELQLTVTPEETRVMIAIPVEIGVAA